MALIRFTNRPAAPLTRSFLDELPGVNSKDVDITLEDDILTVRGEKKGERKEGEPESRYHMWERRYGSFQRAFTLPKAVDDAKISAKFENGVLTITLPKSEKTKVQGRKIPISNGK